MGYNTYFNGVFDFDRSLSDKELSELGTFVENRHDGDGFPSIWCDWMTDETGACLMHNGSEKFYNYVEWLEYLITYFFNPWGVDLNGEVFWSGDQLGDMGFIRVKNNVITTITNCAITPDGQMLPIEIDLIAKDILEALNIVNDEDHDPIGTFNNSEERVRNVLIKHLGD